MDREKLMAEIEEIFAPMFRMLEYDDCRFFQLLELLNAKGIISKDDYNKYLSNEAINKKMDMVNAALREEEN